MKFNLWPAWHTIQTMVWTFIASLPALILGLIVLGVFVVLGRTMNSFIRRVSEKRMRHRHLSLIFGRLAQVVSIVMGVLIALLVAVPSFNPAQLIQILGVSGVAIGFAFRDILQNFLAGMLLLITEPFRIGDQISVDSFEGVVEDVKTRATMIRTYDGRRIVIPNSDLFSKSVTVNTAYDARRVEYTFSIGYSDDIEKARKLILAAVNSVSGVMPTPKPDVLLTAFGESSVDLRARWWIKPPMRSNVLASLDKVLTAVKQEFAENGIDLPYPTRQILFHDQTEEGDGDRSRQREGWPAGKGQVPAPAREANGETGDVKNGQ